MTNRPLETKVAPVERIAGLLFNGNALARHGGFVNRTRTFRYDAVDRNGCAGFQHDQVARSNRLAGDGHFLCRREAPRLFWGKGSKFFNRIRRAAPGACFKPFAYGDERDDHGCAFKIKAVGKMKRMIDLTGSGPKDEEEESFISVEIGINPWTWYRQEIDL